MTKLLPPVLFVLLLAGCTTTTPQNREVRVAVIGGMRPQGDWLLKDESNNAEEVMEFARQKRAYVVLGRIPVIQGIFSADSMEILVQGDPDMRRPFIVMQANPKKFPQANAKGARALADYLLTAKTQNFLRQFGTNSPGGMPLFYPVKTD